MSSRNISSDRGPLGLIRVLAPLKSKFEIDSTTIENQLHSSTLCILQQDTKCSSL